jgi:hypothetical protein
VGPLATRNFDREFRECAVRIVRETGKPTAQVAREPRPERGHAGSAGEPGPARVATVRDRSKITKGPGSRATGIAMAYKLIEASQSRWRAVNAPHLVALVRAGATFENGKLVERPDQTTGKEAA